METPTVNMGEFANHHGLKHPNGIVCQLLLDVGIACHGLRAASGLLGPGICGKERSLAPAGAMEFQQVVRKYFILHHESLKRGAHNISVRLVVGPSSTQDPCPSIGAARFSAYKDRSKYRAMRKPQVAQASRLASVRGEPVSGAPLPDACHCERIKDQT